MTKGQTALCAILRNGERTGQSVEVSIREVKVDFHTKRPASVRVMTVERPQRALWVQPQYLTVQEEKERR